MNNKYLLLLISSAFLYSIGDIILKKVQWTLISSSLILENETIIALLYIAFALIITLLSKLLISVVVSKHSLGLTQGVFIGLDIILSLIFGYFIFNELITFKKIIGILIIILGIFLITKEEN